MEDELHRHKNELFQDMMQQIEFLCDDCKRYDEGDIKYGKRIALTLRVLLHDTKNSHSLLQQISRSFAYNYPDFIDISTNKGHFSNEGRTNFVRTSLCQYRFNHYPTSDSIMVPQAIYFNKDDRYPMRAFNTWWTKQHIILVNNKDFLTRKDVVMLLANKDGGAHIDPILDETLALLKRNIAKPLKLSISIGNDRKTYTAKIDEILYATSRSIGEEVLAMFNSKIIPYCVAHKD